MTPSTAPVAPGNDVAHRARRRITRRLIPFLFALYFVAYLDRVNLSFPALELTREVGFTNEMFAFAAGIFSIGYSLLEIPGALLAEPRRAPQWLAPITITCGIVPGPAPV